MFRPWFRRSPRVLRYRDATIDHCCEKCGVQLRAHHRRASIMLAHPPRSPPARAGFPARKPNRKQKFLRLRLRLRATIVAVRASYYSTTPPAGARRRRALSMPPLPRPPQPRHRMVLAAIAVIAVIAVIAAAPYGLDGYCRIGLSAIAYERTIMPSRRTRRRRGHHHPTRHARRWRRSIDQPPGHAPWPVTRPTKLRGGHRPSTRA